MYIIEKIIKLFLKIKNNKKDIRDYSSYSEDKIEDFVSCKHTFMPIDSTGNVYACSKCGYLVTKERINKNHNFFKYQ